MSNYIIRPQELYLLERYSSPTYFKTMLDAFKQMLDAAETALELFMQDLPYDYRDRQLSEQPDIVWGERVLPNFRSTLEAINIGYQELLGGNLAALQYAGNVETDFRAQRADYWSDWMDKKNSELFNQWQDEAELYAFNIKITSFSYWVTESLNNRLNEEYRGALNLPSSMPIYRVNMGCIIESGEIVPQDGIYIPAIENASAQLMLKGRKAIEALVGLSDSGLQFKSRESTTWVLVERIADEGGSNTVIESQNFKGFAGQTCPRSGTWWSPANRSQTRYFNQGETFPEIPNNPWGETIWYLEVTNRQ